MGNSTTKQRAENGAKTGVFALHDERLFFFPEVELSLKSHYLTFQIANIVSAVSNWKICGHYALRTARWARFRLMS